MENEGWIKQDGSFGDLSTAPESVRNLIESKHYSNVEGLANAYTNAEKKLGVSPENLVSIPDKDDAEGWNKVYTKLGKPEKFEDYALDFKPDVPIDEKIVGDFKKFAHEKLHLNNNQFNEVVKFQLDLSKSIADAQEKQFKEQEEKTKGEKARERETAVAAIRKKYNANDDEKFKEIMSGASKLSKQLGIFETLEKKGLADDPEIIGMLVDIQKNVAESALPKKTEVVVKAGAERLAEIQKNPAFINRMHPEHQQIMAEFHKLCGISGYS